MRHRFLDTLLQRFFHLLYTDLAWSYDIVAWLASMGQWRTWIGLADIGWGTGRLLEIGHGPGHLLADMASRGYAITGLDPSPQMTRMASRRLRFRGVAGQIVGGRSQALPFASRTFAGVLVTFPGPFLFEDASLHEIRRVLQPAGRLVVIALARITGLDVYDRAAAWLNHVTGQSGPPDRRWLDRLARHGFEASQEEVELPRALVLRLIATKAPG